MSENTFGDFYEILQVSQNADFETIERVFRMLAKRYHPDNTQTGNESKFRALVEAYHTLSNPEKRAAYDARHEGMRADRWKSFYEQPLPSDGAEADLKLRHGILSILYTARRRNVLRPGVGIVLFENVLGCPREAMEFHIWYLKEKGFIARTDTGEFAITAAGVDEILSKPTLRELQRLSAPLAEADSDNVESAGSNAE
jgi:curved DNA-binding protein CbpA